MRRHDEPTTVRRRLRAVLFLGVLTCFARAEPAGAFEYAGLGLHVDPVELLGVFPDSRHEFWERGTGSVLLPDDDEERFDTALLEGEGRYVIRLVPDDTRGQVTSVSLSMEAGLVTRMTLGFERSGKGIRPEEIEKRFPGCRGVLDTLVERYGQPSAFKTFNEDNLQHRVRTWVGPEGTMHLDCGRFNGRSAIFAMDIEFVPPSPEPPPVQSPKPAPRPAPKKKP
jgi:hypothetical protein